MTTPDTRMATKADYTMLAGRTESGESLDNVAARIGQMHSAPEQGQRLLHAMLGLCTETGELQDIIKRALFYGGPVHSNVIRANIIEECGDIEWYLALIYRTLDISQADVQTLNLTKLQKRYPNKFSTEDAFDRDIVAEQETFDGA